MDATYGNWSDDWISFLVGASFAAAFFILIIGMLFAWAIKAFR